MTKNEALKAAIDGKKFTHRTGVFPMYFDGDEFVTKENGKVSMSCFPNDNDYAIIPEFVDFAEAWKAYENGKAIQSASSGEKYQNKQYGAFIRVDAIRGKWLILEDK